MSNLIPENKKRNDYEPIYEVNGIGIPKNDSDS